MDIHNDEHIKMYFYENRLKTFEGWPFDEDCECNAENVSVFTPPMIGGQASSFSQSLAS